MSLGKAASGSTTHTTTIPPTHSPDPDLIKAVAVKHFAKFHDRPAFVTMPSGCVLPSSGAADVAACRDWAVPSPATLG